MNIKLKPKAALVAASIVMNAVVLAFLVLAALTKSHTATLSFPTPGTGSIAAATVTAFPTTADLVFNPVEITMQPGQTTSLQYSVFVERKQHNILITALYDHDIISVSQTGYGINITAQQPGETLMQMISPTGIINIATITVIK